MIEGGEPSDYTFEYAPSARHAILRLIYIFSPRLCDVAAAATAIPARAIPAIIYDAARADRSLVGSGPGPIYGVIFTMASADPTRIIKFACFKLDDCSVSTL